MRILLIDDDRSIPPLLEACVRQVSGPDGAEFVVRERGEDGLEVLKEDSFDWVILDLDLPDVSGLVVLQRIRESVPSGRLPVIVISGSQDPGDVVAAFQAGANDYLQKPLTAVQFQARYLAERERRRLVRENARLLMAADKTGAVLITDAAGVIEWANPGFVEMTGYSLAEVEGRKPGSFLQGPATDPATIKLMRQALARMEGFEVEIFNYRKDGAGFWVAIKVVPDYAANGRVFQFVGTQFDVTARKCAESALKEERRFLKNLVANLPGLVYRRQIWPEERLVFVSDGCGALTGYDSAEAAVGEAHSLIRIVAGQDVAGVENAYQRCARSAEPIAMDYRIVTKGGETRWVHERATPLQDGTGRVVEIEGFIQDIHDRKTAEQAVLDRESRLDAILAAEPECVTLVSEAGVLLQMNPAGLAMMEAASPGEVIGREMAHIVVPEHRSRFQMCLQQVFEGMPCQIEFEIVGCREGRRWMEQHAVPLFDPTSPGRVTAMLAVSRDVTDRRRAALALRESEERWKFALEGAGHGMWDWYLPDGEMIFSDTAKGLLGYESHEIESRPDEWLRRIHPDDTEEVMRSLRAHWTGRSASYHCEQRVRCRDGSWKWLLTRGLVIRSDSDGRPLRMIGTATDISEQKAEAERTSLHAKAMTLLAMGAPILEILEVIALKMEVLGDGVRCAIFLVDETGTRMRVGAGPSLPDELLDAVDGIGICDDGGACGRAISRAEVVVVEDVETDPLCKDLASQLLKHGIRACWSHPILESRGRVLGTFAVFHRHRHIPSEQERARARDSAQLTALAVEKTEAQQALRASKERWKFAVEGSGHGVWDWDVPTGKVHHSKRWNEMLGYADGNGVWETAACWKELVHPDDFEEAWGALSSHLKGESSSYQSELRLRCADGGWKWVLDRGLVITRDENGKAVRVIGTHTDISALKESVEALEESENQLRLALEISGLGLWRSNFLTGEAFWDGRMLEIFGLERAPTPAELLEIVSPEDRARWEMAWEAMVMQEKALNLELSIRRRDGRAVNITARARAHRNAGGEVDWITGVTADVTAQRQAAEALRASEERLKLIFDTVAEGLVVMDGNGLIREYNARAEAILGLIQDPVTGHTMMDPEWTAVDLDGSNFPPGQHPLMVALQTGVPVQDVMMGVRKPGGSMVWIEISSVPMKDSHGAVALVVTSFTDVSNRLATEAELARAHKFRALGEIVGGVAHEFNNLLQPMLIQMTTLQGTRELPDAVREELEPVSEAVNQAIELCQRVLSMGRNATGSHEVMELPKQVRGAVALMEAGLDSRLEVALHMATDTPKVWLPRSQLAQVLLNLLLNARDTVMEKLGKRHALHWRPRIEVHTARRRARKPKQRGELGPDEADWAVVVVKDSGMGMAPEVKARIFEPFFTTKPGSQGTGLGLAVIWNLVDSFQGWIDAESVEGEGSTFTVYLPISPLGAVSTPRAKTGVEVGGQPRVHQRQRVLLVEDHEVVARTFKTILSTAGHEVERAVDGVAAWEILLKRHSEFDVVLSDLMMPRMTGIELAGLLQQIAYRGRIVLVSGYISSAQREELQTLQVHKLLHKPVNPDALLEALDSREPIPLGGDEGQMRGEDTGAGG